MRGEISKRASVWMKTSWNGETLEWRRRVLKEQTEILPLRRGVFTEQEEGRQVAGRHGSRKMENFLFAVFTSKIKY